MLKNDMPAGVVRVKYWLERGAKWQEKLSELLSGIQNMVYLAVKMNAPKRIRIAVAGLKGRCPRPLDDGGILH